jgi:hypothetical protein
MKQTQCWRYFSWITHIETLTLLKFLNEFWAFYRTEKLKSSLNRFSHGTFDDLNDSYICPAYIYVIILAILQFRWVICHSLTKPTFYVVSIFLWNSCGVKAIHFNRLYIKPYFGYNTYFVLKSILRTESSTFCCVIFPYWSQEVWKIFEVNNTYIVTNFGKETTRLLRIIRHRKLKYSFIVFHMGRLMI